MDRRGSQTVVHPRHWMHIWKVGFRRCDLCAVDSRFIATTVDEHGEVIEQRMYCKAHAHNADTGTDFSVDEDDLQSGLVFGLGFSAQIDVDIESPDPADINTDD